MVMRDSHSDAYHFCHHYLPCSEFDEFWGLWRLRLHGLCEARTPPRAAGSLVLVFLRRVNAPKSLQVYGKPKSIHGFPLAVIR